MDILTAKIIAMVLMGTLALFFGLLPLKVKSMILKGEENSRKRRRRERIVSGLLCFGSGVLMATVFIHMIPETREGFQRAKKLGLLASDSHDSHASHDHESHRHNAPKHFHSEEENAHEDHHGIHSNHSNTEETSESDHSGHDHRNLPPHHEHEEHSSHDGHHDENERGHSHTTHMSGHTESMNFDGTAFGNAETEKPAELRKIPSTEEGSILHAHDEHNSRANLEKSHLDERMNIDKNFHTENPSEFGNESEGLPQPEHSGPASSEKDSFSHESSTLSSEPLSGQDMVTTKPLLTLEEGKARESSVSTGNHAHSHSHDHTHEHPHDHAHDHAEEHPHDHPHDHDHTHDHSHDHAEEHPHDHPHDHTHDHSHDHAEEHPHDHFHNHTNDHLHDSTHVHSHNHAGSHGSSESGPQFGHAAILHAKNPADRATLLEQKSNAPEIVVSEEAKNLEYPKENSIRTATNDSHHAGEGVHSSPLTHKEEDHDHGHDHGDDHGYPFAELVICAGFFLIYIIEEVMHKVLFRRSGKESEKKNLLSKDLEDGTTHDHSDHLSHIPHFHAHANTSSSEDEDAPSRQKPASSSNGTVSRPTVDESDKTMSPRNDWGRHGVDNPVFAGDIDATSWNPKVRNSVVMPNQVSPMSSNENPKMYGTASASDSPAAPPCDADKKKSSSIGVTDHIMYNLRSLLIVIALSFHSVFEGMAVGLQEVLSDVWYLFLAISAHKFVIVFCIGLELLEAKTPLVLMILYMVVLALVSPFGVGIGILVTENSSLGGQEHTLIITILQGIAGGTILYVAFLEVLERERSKRGGRFIKLICLMLGFALMASLEAIGGHSHGPIGGAA